MTDISAAEAWADRSGQDRRIAFMSVRPGQHDAQLFWLALLGAVRAATGGAEPPPAAPGFNGQAMVDKVRPELAASGGPFVLIIDDLRELSSAEAAEQLTALLTSLPRASTRSWPPAATRRCACISCGLPGAGLLIHPRSPVRPVRRHPMGSGRYVSLGTTGGVSACSKAAENR